MLGHRKNKTTCNWFIFPSCKTNDQQNFLFQLALPYHRYFLSLMTPEDFHFFLFFQKQLQIFPYFHTKTLPISLNAILWYYAYAFGISFYFDLQVNNIAFISWCCLIHFNELCSFHNIFIFSKQTNTRPLNLNPFHISFREKKSYAKQIKVTITLTTS